LSPLLIHQPAYLPWIGYFARMLLAKQFVLLDHVQYTDGGWQNRNYILGANPGSRCRLTLPLLKKGRFGQSFANVVVADRSATRRHWRAITMRYGKAPHFHLYSSDLRSILDREWTTMTSLCDVVIRYMMYCLDLQLPVVRSSSLGLTSRRTVLLADLCDMHGCDSLITGSGAIHYLDTDLLTTRGIAHRPDGFHHPTYVQVLPGFVSHLSALDLLMHAGPGARDLLRTSVRRPIVGEEPRC
jgi:WbqC-like protein